MSAAGNRLATYAGLAALAAAVAWSFASGGLVRVLVDGTLNGEAGIAPVREYVLSWGALAPAVYVVAVTVEVLVAPIPGSVLYAPGGAIFGGWWGGTLSLVGNVAGAAIATAIGRALGEAWVSARLERRHLDRFRDRLATRAVWVIALLRVNPLTSSDLVSYAAGAFGVSPMRVALGTLLGMAPLCYAQAYAAEAVFRWIPGSGFVVALVGLAYFVLVVWLLAKRRVR
jgi:uncharacterized membrane protein YdjX (TVP38/TMEM64 family)